MTPMLGQLSDTAWFAAIAHPAAEFPPTPLPLKSGRIPDGLRGTLYRNGPGRLQRGETKVQHWFDGDGAILAVHFTDRGATGVYRYVQTDGYQAEEAAGQLLYNGYGTRSPGPVWKAWRYPFKNAANTSVLPLTDKLLALWEGGKPYALDLQNLTTWGEDDLGALKAGMAYSAHAKRDPNTGEIFNFGVQPGPRSTLNLYRSAISGQILQHNAIALHGLPLVHDFVIAGPYCLFLIPPVRLNSLPALMRLVSFSDGLHWQPELGTQVLVIDRQSLTLKAQATVDPWFQWHYANAFIEDRGLIVVDLVRYPDFQTNRYLQEVPSGTPKTLAFGTLWRIWIDPATGLTVKAKELLDRNCEFPGVPSQSVGRRHNEIYLSIHRKGCEASRTMFGAIARFNVDRDELQESQLDEGLYPTEPIHVQDRDRPEQRWIITLVYDSHHHASEVWVFDSQHLDDEPVCCLGLPSVVPFGFHGAWAASQQSQATA